MPEVKTMECPECDLLLSPVNEEGICIKCGLNLVALHNKLRHELALAALRKRHEPTPPAPPVKKSNDPFNLL